MTRFIGSAVAFLLAASATASAAPLLQSVAPVATDFTHIVDFAWMTGTGVGDVTAPLFAVDLFIPVPAPSASTSGCDAVDFAGFDAGSIALIQRGTCAFALKVANAEAAGAAGVIIFNDGFDDGSINRKFLFAGTLVSAGFSVPVGVPVFSTSFFVGDQLRNGVLSGPTGYTVRMKVAEEDLPVPEPASVALLGLGLVGLARSRRLRRAR